MLEIKNLSVSYADTPVLHDINLVVNEGEFLAVLGPNGAGKTTLMRALSGYFDDVDGSSHFNGEDLTGLEESEITERGICHVQEEDAIFTDMSIIDNLLAASLQENAKEAREENLEVVFDIFERLEERRDQLAGTLSGGERRMLSVGMGIMSNPDLLLLDEPSAGLAPNLVDKMFQKIESLASETGITVLLVEQRMTEALAIAERAYILDNGRIRAEGTAEEFLESDLRETYFGLE
jgi:branched-chain amino acid transport system ATP-binding protein